MRSVSSAEGMKEEEVEGSVVRDEPEGSGSKGYMPCPEDDLGKHTFSLFDSLLIGSSSTTTKSLRSFMARDKS